LFIISMTTSCQSTTTYNYTIEFLGPYGSSEATVVFEIATDPGGPWIEIARQFPSIPMAPYTYHGTFENINIPFRYVWYRVRAGISYLCIPVQRYAYGESLPIYACTSSPNATFTPTPIASITTIPTSISTNTSIPTSMITGTVTVLPTATPTPCAIQFSDVLPDSTFYDYIMDLACRSIISGYPDGTFRPGNYVTRGQLSKIVSNAAGFNDAVASYTYTDVPEGSTFWLWIERLTIHQSINGYPCGDPTEPCDNQDRPYFRPAANATRGQIAKISVVTAIETQGWTLVDPPDNTFEDVQTGSTFYQYIETAYAHNVLNGYPCGNPPAGPCVPPANKPYFLPNNNATRGQTAKIIDIAFPGP
jgi:hypothetical protein